ncbi:MAG: hypothetical protein IKC46_03425 [Lachnospiraceae bacterium]|nr:hypothetical protein [Lachnospiraceae bacterium]
MKKKLISMILVTGLLASTLIGCGSEKAEETQQPAAETKTEEKAEAPAEEKAEEPAEEKVEEAEEEEEIVQIRFIYEGGNFDSNWPTEVFNDLNAALREYAGAELVMVNGANEQIDMMLASGDLNFDMFKLGSSYVDTMIKAGMVTNLEDYKDQLPNVFSNDVRVNALRAFNSGDTGDLHVWTTAVGPELNGRTQNYGYTVRWDWYKELGCPEITDRESYLNVLKQMVEAHPETENGDKVYGFSFHQAPDIATWATMGNINGTTHFSPTMGWDTINGKFCNLITDVERSGVWFAIEWAYMANQMGIMDPDALTQTRDDMEAKATNGQLAGPFSPAYGGDLEANSLVEDPNSIAGYISVPVEGVSYWDNKYSDYGWGCYIGAVKDSPYQEQMMKVFEYLNSEEGARMCGNGVEGRQWDYVDGVPTIKPEMIEINKTGDATAKLQTRYLNNMFYGISMRATHSDGYPMNLWFSDQVLMDAMTPMEKDYSEFYGVNLPIETSRNQIEAGKAYDLRNITDVYNIIGGNGPDDIARMESRIAEAFVARAHECVLAKDDAEFKKIQDEIIAECIELGVEEVEAYWSGRADEIYNTLYN